MRGRYQTEIHDQLVRAEGIVNGGLGKDLQPIGDQPIRPAITPWYIGVRDRGQVVKCAGRSRRYGAGHPYAADQQPPAPFTQEETAAQEGLFAVLQDRRHSAAHAIAEELARIADALGSEPAPPAAAV